MANEINRLFTKTAQVKRLTDDIDDADKEGYSIVVTALACHTQPLSPELTVMLDGALYQSYKLWCARGSNILEQDLVTIDSIQYIVKGVEDWNVGNNPHLQAVIQKIGIPT